MPENLRQFDVSDPFGRQWSVEFRWQQNAISIRHSDTIDCKYYLTDGEEKREIVVALRHQDLLALSAARGRELTDAWCLRLAGLHLEHMISTWEDMEQTVVTAPRHELERHSLAIQEAEQAVRERAILSH